MVAAIKDTELSAMLQDLLKANATFFIETIEGIAMIFLPPLFWVIIPATVGISAVASFVVFTHSEAIRILQEQVNYLVVIRHLIEFLFSDGSEPSLGLVSGSLEPLLVKFLLLVQEGVMLDNVIDIVDFRVVFRLHDLLLLLRRNINSTLGRGNHHLGREVDSCWHWTPKHRLRGNT